MIGTIPKFHRALKNPVAVMFLVMPLLMLFYGHVSANSMPDAKLNGSDHLGTLSSSNTLTATIELNAGDQTGELADWWILVETPVGWYFYDQIGIWNFSEGNLSDLSPAYQDLLFDLTNPREVLRITGLPTGEYVFYFGVDTTVNGQLDMETISYDSVAVTVVDAISYPVVDTNQKTCYDNSGSISCPSLGESFYGQDATYSNVGTSYTDNGDGTITDNITGLMWVKARGSKVTWDEAVAGASTNRTGEYEDWRMPTIKELYSLFLHSGVNGRDYMSTTGFIPFIDTDYFDFKYGSGIGGERVIDCQDWSGTEYVSTTQHDQPTVFGINFADGRSKGYKKFLPPAWTEKNTLYVRYVRGNEEYGKNNFQNNSDGTISDLATGLMWSEDDSKEGLDWEQALAWVQAKNVENYLGHSDWRLPNIKELHSIVDYTRSPEKTSSAAINTDYFKCSTITNETGQEDYPYFWSGTVLDDGPVKDGTYIPFGRAMAYLDNVWQDVHGAGSQKSDVMVGDPAKFPEGRGPQGDAVRIYNYVRLVRDI